MIDSYVIYVYPQLLRVVLGVFLFLAGVNRKALAAAFRGQVSPGGLSAAGLIFLLALALRLFFIPHVHHVFYDALEHLNIAQNLARSQAFGESVVGGRADFTVFTVPFWPGSYHIVLGLLFSCFGYREAAAFWLNAVMGALTVPLFYLLGASWLKDELAGLLAAFLLAVSPLHLHYSGSSDLAVPALFWASASLLCLRVYLEKRTAAFYALFLGAAIMAVNSRPEYCLLVPLFGAILYRGFSRKILWHALTIPLLIPLAYILLRHMATNAAIFGREAAETTASFPQNCVQDLTFIFSPFLSGLLLAFLLLPGTVAGLKRIPREASLLIGFFAVFFLFYAAYAPPFTLSIYNKYSLILCLPMFLLAGLGAAALEVGRFWKKAAVLGFAGLFVLLWRPLYGNIATEFNDAERIKYAFLRDSATLLPQDAYIISYSPAAINALIERPSVSARFLLDHKGEFDAALARQNLKPELILFKDYWWYEDEAASRRLEAMLKAGYRFSTLAQMSLENLDFAFYRLTPK